MQTVCNLFRECGRATSVSIVSKKYKIYRLSKLEKTTLQQSIEIIRRRLDPDGTKEPIIQQQGKDRILVQLPGVDDPERIKRLLGKTAKLTFQLVNTKVSINDAKIRSRLPANSVILESVDENAPDFVVYKRVMVSGEMLDNASAGFDQNNSPAVNFQLNAPHLLELLSCL